MNPRLADSDGDGIADGDEDRDWDGLSNQQELQTYGTDPAQPDTDMDTLPDGWEVDNGFSPTVPNSSDGDPTNDPGADPDGDGLTNTQEADHGTLANNADTDGDGVSDAIEVGQGSNPRDPNDSQPPPEGTVPVNITFGDDSGSHSEKYRVRLVPLEGDSSGYGQRYRTNRAYGEPQTDTFQLPRGSKYRVELEHAGTDLTYDWEPRPDYDYVLEVDTSQGGLVLEDDEGIAGEHSESYSFYAAGKSATLYVPLFKTKEVSFSASTIGNLQSDDTSTTYEAPHWQDSNDDGDADDSGERKYPIAYVRNTPPSIAAKITVKPTGLTSLSGFSAKIKVTGPGALAVPAGQPNGTQLTYYASYNCVNVTTENLLANGDGQCGAWAKFFIDLRKVQGIDDTNEYVIFYPSGPSNIAIDFRGFVVNNWTFSGSGTSGVTDFPYLNIPSSNLVGANSYNWRYAEVNDSQGIPGQGTENPASLFNNHQVVISGEYYDPSYGLKHASLSALDDNAIDGFYVLTSLPVDESQVNLDLNGDGDQIDEDVPTGVFLFRKNTSGLDLTEERANY